MLSWLHKLTRRAFSERTGQWVGESPTSSGVSVTPTSAMQLATVFSCIRVLSESLASLPLHLHRRIDARSSEIVSSHPAATIFRDGPNDEMRPHDFKTSSMSCLNLRGNSYWQIVRDGGSRPRQLWPLSPDRIRVDRDASKRLIYHYTPPDGPEKTFARDEILHLRGMSTDGVLGMSPIAYARETIGLAVAAERWGAKVFTSSGRPAAWIEMPTTFKSKEDSVEFQRNWESAYGGVDGQSKTPVLTGGMKLNRLDVKPDEAQFLETRKYQRTEICGLFRVPPHMIADLERATFSNIEYQGISFGTYTMLPWCVAIEEDLNAALLTPAERAAGMYFKFAMNGLLRGAVADRYRAYSIGRQWGWLSANDVRALEDLNAIEGGDDYLVPLNMSPAAPHMADQGVNEPPAEGVQR